MSTRPPNTKRADQNQLPFFLVCAGFARTFQKTATLNRGWCPYIGYILFLDA